MRATRHGVPGRTLRERLAEMATFRERLFVQIRTNGLQDRKSVV